MRAARTSVYANARMRAIKTSRAREMHCARGTINLSAIILARVETLPCQLRNRNANPQRSSAFFTLIGIKQQSVEIRFALVEKARCSPMLDKAAFFSAA